MRLLLMTGARLSDLILLNRLMIKQTDVGRILTYNPVYAQRRSDTSLEGTGIWVVGRMLLSRSEVEALARKCKHDQERFT